MKVRDLSEWYLKMDPANKGIDEQWFKSTNKNNSWKKIAITDAGWGNDIEYGWYKTTINIADYLGGNKYIYLYFNSVDEDSDVYINGEKVFECNWKTMNTVVAGTWNLPFSVNITPYIDRTGENSIIVRVFSRMHRGGIYRKVFLIGTEKKSTTQQIGKLLCDNNLLTEHDYKLDFGIIPPVPKADNQHLFGARIQRTMTLLETSNIKLKHKVKILFYGQSITLGLQWQDMIADLKKKYPHAEIVVENRAIGGFAAPSLVRTAVHDLYSFYPDLVVFHVYGQGDPLERIIYNIRKYTTAEIMLYTHHVVWNSKNQKKSDTLHEQGTDFYHYLAQQYNCELVQVRKEWKHYLKLHNMKENELMGDTVHSNVHPNRRGHRLLRELIIRHFQYNTLYGGGWYNTVRTYEAKRPIEEADDEIVFTGKPWRKSRLGIFGRNPDSALILEFNGNRIDVQSFPLANHGSARILIDGHKPSEIQSLYYNTRPVDLPDANRPPLKRVSIGKNSVEETWSLKLLDDCNDGITFLFELTGSLTGFDGKGTSQKDFVSNSGRIIIHFKDFVLKERLKILKGVIPKGHTITWQTKLLGMDTWKPIGIKNANIQGFHTLAQGLSNTTHVVQIIPNGDGNIPVKSLRVYSPPLK